MNLNEKAKSKDQQKFFGMVHKCQKSGDCASKEVEDVSKSISKKDAEEFASTKHKGLPEDVDDKDDDRSDKVKEESLWQQWKTLKEQT